MIRKFREQDLDSIMQIWLNANTSAHDFIAEEYWTDHYTMVKRVLPDADVYVYEDDATQQIMGFIGLMDDYIAGIFVKEAARSKGIGKQLLNYVKMSKPYLNLHVYQKNIRAVSFYQKEGFTIQAENTDNDTDEKEYIMDWRK